ncbi:MFS transporter [Streptococcus marmotae]|uniref:MFS transporter n=1 Tax=Streptococcus marmotae TaxID=1825069 RepID=UPI00082A952A|nr:MFS transporter [Streptococcus marmotae]
MKQFFNQAILDSRIKKDTVGLVEKSLGYFVGPFLALISNAILASYLNRYYSDVIGWTDSEKFGIFSATLPIVSVILVVIGNLVLGRLIDTTRTRQGKARPYLFLSAFLVALSLLVMFTLPLEGNPIVQMLWIALSYNFYYAVAYPFFYTSHSSMVSLSTRDSNSRGLLATLSNAAGVAAVGLGASILVPIFLQNILFVEHDGSLDRLASYQNWRWAIGILCLITLVGILLEYYFTRERVTEEENQLASSEKSIPLMQQLKVCLSNKYWWLIILYFLLFQLGGLIKNGSMSYYSRWMFEGVTTEAAAGSAMGMLGFIGGLPTALGMVVAWPIANKLGKQKAIVLGLIISVLGGLVSFIDVHNFVIVCVGVVLKGIGSIPAMYVTLALLSDVLDYLELKNGFRSDGLTMSVYGAIMVGMSGIGNGIINSLLSSAGYDPSLTAQSDMVSSMLVFCYLGAELICYAILVVLVSFLTVEKKLKNS